MKTITLPNGKVAHFPDTIHPDKMQAAIDRHGREKPAIMVVHDHETNDDRSSREARQENAHKTRHHEAMFAMNEHNKKTNSAIGEHTKATVAVAQSLNQGLDALVKSIKDNAKTAEFLGQKIDNLAKTAMEIKQLSKCVNLLQEQLKDSTDMIVKAMKSPRKIVHSPKGRPIGMQIGDE